MTVEVNVPKVSAGGNGSATDFSFRPMTIFTNTDLVVTKVDINGVETVLSEGTGPTNYTVNVTSYPGTGSITYPSTGTGYLLTGEKVVMQCVVPILQPTNLENQGGYFPDVQETSFDRGIKIAQQLQEQIDRSVKTTVGDDFTPDELIDSIKESEQNAAASADDAALIFDQFSLIYLGSKTSDPSVNNDGGPLINGSMYFNEATGKLRIYGGTWQDAATATPVNYSANTFSGNGVTTAFTLSSTPVNVQSTLVNISGITQRPTTDFTVSGTTLTFTAAPPTGTNNISVLVVSALSVGTPSDGTVGESKLFNGFGLVPTAAMMIWPLGSAPTNWLLCDGSAVNRSTYGNLFSKIGTNFGVGDGATTFNLPDLRGRTVVGAGAATFTETFTSAAVSAASDTITVGSNNHRYNNGMVVQFATTGTLPSPLVAATNYYITRIDATTIKVSTSVANYVAGTFVDISAVGAGTHTITYTGGTRAIGEIGGESNHQQNIAEMPSHTHGIGVQQTWGGTSTTPTFANPNNTVQSTATGGSVAFNLMQPFLGMNFIIRT